ncbi:hypothetical protein TraAM80_03623 [Trypanosoma rangeli]|uniref:Uncharacterized protein n=1 Tax=Trypanosoma rangeli TaxID=5698 RepID=A0A422NMF2_TRYRA|nr:uncharacterized protein TraAM80_03623 [Trypanosoma rangeli]RNF06678.1 hypothetical protein TraAM80_03623 [Trypanosoma rangeli]|eukprot:RNF06678.1 hypothetical protein TraAM80_03623 [Trypanosoma rangeli]
MSFRYTNNLVGALKHRMMLESSHRELVRRRFTGHCRGVEVVCSGYGTVLAVRLVDKVAWEPFYRKGLSSSTAEGNSTSNDNAVSPPVGGATVAPVDFEKLAESIKAALWVATRKIRSAKEEALQRSLSHNKQMRAGADLAHWYEEDANTLRPLAFEALQHETATPWMQFVQFGKHEHAAALLQHESGEQAGECCTGDTKRDSLENAEGHCVTALDAKDVDPTSIPIGSVHPLFLPALIQIESRTSSSLNDEAIRQEQWREMSRDEQLFWERVELIRKGQVAVIKGGHKRDYADEAAVASDSAVDKVQLRFTQ